jgi:hypothetical protein
MCIVEVDDERPNNIAETILAETTSFSQVNDSVTHANTLAKPLMTTFPVAGLNDGVADAPDATARLTMSARPANRMIFMLILST